MKKNDNLKCTLINKLNFNKRLSKLDKRFVFFVKRLSKLDKNLLIFLHVFFNNVLNY